MGYLSAFSKTEELYSIHFFVRHLVLSFTFEAKRNCCRRRKALTKTVGITFPPELVFLFVPMIFSLGEGFLQLLELLLVLEMCHAELSSEVLDF